VCAKTTLPKGPHGRPRNIYPASPFPVIMHLSICPSVETKREQKWHIKMLKQHFNFFDKLIKQIKCQRYLKGLCALLNELHTTDSPQEYIASSFGSGFPAMSSNVSCCFAMDVAMFHKCNRVTKDEVTMAFNVTVS
jgi:hypothetical protein